MFATFTSSDVHKMYLCNYQSSVYAILSKLFLFLKGIVSFFNKFQQQTANGEIR